MTAVQTEYHDLRTTRQAAASRLAALEELAKCEHLTDSEETECAMLRSRLAHLAPRLEAAQQALVQETDRLDVAAVVAHWETLMDAKRAAYATFVETVATLRQAHAWLVEVHRQQEAAVVSLPRQVAERLNFPDGGTFRMRLAGAMRNPMGWTAVLCTPQGLEVPRSEELQSVDPGSQPLAPRVIQRFLEGRP